MEKLRQWVREWWGLLAPALAFLIGDMGLPDDAPWWVPWMAAVVSGISYLVGRVNGEKAENARLVGRVEELEGRLAEQAEIDEEASRAFRERQARGWVMSLDPDEKLILLNLSRKGGWVTGHMGSNGFRDEMARLRRGVDSTRVDMDWKGDYAYRLYLNDFGELAVRVGMDLLEDVARIRAEREEVEGAE